MKVSRVGNRMVVVSVMGNNGEVRILYYDDVPLVIDENVVHISACPKNQWVEHVLQSWLEDNVVGKSMVIEMEDRMKELESGVIYVH